MKYQVIFAIALALFGGALANPLVETPETRLVSFACQTNLTVTTVNYCTTTQTDSFAQLTGTFFTLNLNYFSAEVFTAYNWFYWNYATVGFQLAAINTALTMGDGTITKTSVTSAMSVIVNALNQANTYYAVMSPSGASAMSVKIQAVVSLQGQINSALSCAKIWQTLANSCTDSLFTKIAQFTYQSATIMHMIISGWCGICSSDPTMCAVASSTTTPASTTTSTEEPTTTTTEVTSTTTGGPDGDAFLNFTECLATIGFVTAEAALALSASFWELNIHLFSSAISGPYFFFLENIGMAFMQGSIMASGMLMFGSYGCSAIQGSSQMMIDVLLQANEYIMMIDAASYAEISIEIELLISLQLEFMGELSHCKHDLSPLWHSCGVGPYWKLSMFLFRFAFLLNRIIVIWCNICSAMPDICENPMSTSTMSTTTGSTTAEDTTTTTAPPTTTTSTPAPTTALPTTAVP